MASFGPVFIGTIGGMVGASVAFYAITVRQAFGGTTPIAGVDTVWQTKSEDLQMDGQWVCPAVLRSFRRA
jgi:hypothetical protein